MKLSLACALCAALPLSAFADSDFDRYPPSWRGGQYSIQIGWEWPAAPSDITNMPPTTFVTVDGQTPGTLENMPPHGLFNANTLETGWQWTANLGRPGLEFILGQPFIGGVNLYMPHWERGVGREPTLFRVQLTFDGPAPQLCVPPGNAGAISIWGNPNHYVVDQEITDWAQDGVGFWAYPGTIIRNARIDTITIPSPSAVVAIGCLGFMGRRRRHS